MGWLCKFSGQNPLSKKIPPPPLLDRKPRSLISGRSHMSELKLYFKWNTLRVEKLARSVASLTLSADRRRHQSLWFWEPPRWVFCNFFAEAFEEKSSTCAIHGLKLDLLWNLLESMPPRKSSCPAIKVVWLRWSLYLNQVLNSVQIEEKQHLSFFFTSFTKASQDLGLLLLLLSF